MNIAVDISRAVNESAGIGRYCRSVIKELVKQDKQDTFCLYATYVRGDQQKQAIARSIFNRTVTRYRLPGQLKEWLWGSSISLPDRWCPASQVLFASSFFELPLGTRKKSVVAIMDMTTFLYPEQRGFALSERHNERVNNAVAKADHVLTISSKTKADLVGLCNVSPKKVTVTLLAADPIFQPQPNVKKEDIILAVGTIEPRKNLDRLIRAYASLPVHLIKQFKLVIIGAAGWNYEAVLQTLDRSNVNDRIELLGRVDDRELVGWYNKARLFVYPSLYEGFGLPPLEALSCGLPVVTSNVSSLPEVVGDAALKVDPYDVEAIANAMGAVLTKPQLARKLSRAGLRQAKKFSWHKTAKQTLDVIHSL